MRLDIEVFGDVQFSRELLRVGERAGDLRPVFADLVDDFHSMEREQFDTEGGAASGGWAPLKDTTVERKDAAGLDPRILHATLALRRSLTERSAPGSIAKFTSDELTVGTAVRSPQGFPYPAAHQNPQKGQTQRRPIEFTPERRIDWVKKIQRHILGTKV